MMLGEKVLLRALEPSDLPILYDWENDTRNWTVSNTLAPFSRCLLEKFIETSAQDIYTNKQLRLMVVDLATSHTVGVLDVFDFEPAHRRAGIGILIEPSSRGQGFGKDSVLIAKKYLFDVLKLHQIYCHIMVDNIHSISLFQKCGFEICGQKKEWVLTSDGYVDEYILQCLNKDSLK